MRLPSVESHLRSRDPGAMGNRRTVIGDDLDAVVLPDTNARVGGTEVNADGSFEDVFSRHFLGFSIGVSWGSGEGIGREGDNKSVKTGF